MSGSVTERDSGRRRTRENGHDAQVDLPVELLLLRRREHTRRKLDVAIALAAARDAFEVFGRHELLLLREVFLDVAHRGLSR